MKKKLLTQIISSCFTLALLFPHFQTFGQHQCKQHRHQHGFCAVAPSPDPLELIQPDGSAFLAKIEGSAAVNYLETMDGYVVLKTESGAYEYAIEGNQGNLIPSGISVKEEEERTAEDWNFLSNINKQYRYSANSLAKKLNDYQTEYDSHMKTIAGAFPSFGVNKALLLLIDYPDQPFINSVAQFDDYCNEPGYSYNGQTGSFRDYFLDVSYGNLTVNSDVEGWYTATNNRTYYGYHGGTGYDEARELVREAVDAAEAAGVDFSQYDNDGDGKVDQIMIIHSGNGREASGDDADIWSHKSSLGGLSVTYDGVEISEFIIQPERYAGDMANIGIFVHEFGHALGLPDLYDYDGSSSGLGRWCLMSGGTWNNSGKTPSHMSAWCKQEVGWMTPSVLVGNGSISNMDHVESFNESYRMNTPVPSEYFLLENRQKVGWDAYLPGEGLAVWHVDDSQTGNQNEWQALVSLRQADGQYDLQNDQGSDNGDLYPGSSGNNVFDENSTPDSDNYNGSNSGVNVTNITESGIVMSFNYGAPAYPSTVIRGPYLQSGTSSSTIIKWRTSNNTNSKVWYGSSPTNLNQTESVGGTRTDHEVSISGLSPNTTYYYAIGDNGGQMEGANVEHYFKTAPTIGTSQPITAWILGDCGTANSNQEAVRDAYYNYTGSNHTDMMLLLGDNAYNDGWDSEYQDAIFEMYPAKLTNTMLWSCPGNHDYYGQSGLSADYYDIFSFPTAGQAGGLASNTEKYYSFDYGNLHIISLDSYDENRSPGSPMLTWLENDLAATSQEWVVVIFHHPPYSKGSHDSDNTGEYRMIQMRENVLPICEAYGVDLVLSGHSHSYERSKLINGHFGFSSSYNPSQHDIDGGDGRTNGDGAYQQNNNDEGTVYIVTGSAGKKSSMAGTHPIMYYSVSQLGSTILEVNGGQMDVKFLNEYGVIEDYMTIIQNGTPSVSWTNPLNQQVFTNLSPINLNVNASDNDGNVTQVQFYVNNVLVGADNNAPYSLNWTPPTYDDYTLKAVATDNDGNTNFKEIDITVQNGASVDIVVNLNNGNDDVEEKEGTGSVYMTSSDLELIYDSWNSQNRQTVGLRFNGVNIPQGAMITNAYIQFAAKGSDSGSVTMTIEGHDTDNAPAFSTASFNVSGRPATSASVSWSPSSWSTGQNGTAQQSPNLKDIVNEIVDRSGWSFGNSMVFMISGSDTNKRKAYSYDDNTSLAASLYISYTIGNNDPCDPFTDNDNDGYCSDVDCDDNNAAIYPGAPEICDGLDNDCDGQTDEGLLQTFYQDADGDGFGNANNSLSACAAPSGYVTDNTDCDDSNSSVYPGANEICDGLDNDCDGQIDETGLNTFYADSDGDGYGNPNSSIQDCFAPNGYVLDNTDCNDNNAAIYPNAPEICDGFDNDCDGQTDEGLIQNYYLDADNDGYGDPNTLILTCNPPAGYVLTSGDCNDSNSSIYPNAPEICDGIDNNCNGQIDEGTCTYCTPLHSGSQNELITNVSIGSIDNSSSGWNTSTTGYSDYTSLSTELDIGTNYTLTVTSNYSWSGSWMGIWADWDQDFEFDSNEQIAAISGEGPWTANFSPPSWASLGTTRLRIRLQYNPNYTPDPCAHSGYNSGETEDYSLEVVNCNTSIFYVDNDGDGYGNANISVVACSAPAGYVANSTDCNDEDANANPGQNEICDGIDNDCDGQIDEGLLNTYYADADGDGYGNAGNSIIACSPPTGYVTNNTDCDDTDAGTYPFSSCDDGNPLTSNDQNDANCNCSGTSNSGTIIVSSTISSGDNDVEERISDGDISVTSSDLEMTEDGSDQQIVGMRFNNIGVPQGAIIHYAYLQFTADESDDDPTNLTIYGEDANNASPFLHVDYNLSNRNATTASVNWIPVQWFSGDAGTDQQSPNIAMVVQEIVDRNGWVAGNSMAIMVSGTGERTAESYNGSPSQAAQLIIEYSPPVGCNGNELSLEIQLDDYPEETTWEVKDNIGNVVASGGPYNGQNNQLIQEDLCLPNACYEFIIYDDWADGICCDYGNGSYTLKDNLNQIIVEGGSFGSSESTNFCLPYVNNVNYCGSNGNTTSYEWLESVSIGNMTNNSGDNGGYGDFTGMTVTAQAGDVLPVTLTPGFSGSTYTEEYQIWIDFNHDGDFDDTGEAVFNASNNQAVSGTITVPTNAVLVPTRIRVSMKWGGAPTSCESFTYGEVEDYELHLNTSSLLGADDRSSGDAVGEPIVYTTQSRMELASGELNCYPNPAKDQLTVDYQSNTEGAGRFYLFDALGKEVYSQNLVIEEGLNRTILELRHLPNGVYLLHLQEQDQVITKQIVINN